MSTAMGQICGPSLLVLGVVQIDLTFPERLVHLGEAGTVVV
jgi:hypothetical protein